MKHPGGSEPVEFASWLRNPKCKGSPMKIELGNTYSHVRLDITGVAIAYTEYLTGCNQICLERLLEGKVQHDWFDETNIRGAEKTVESDPGGPQPMAPRAG